jgi:hypothetical protein
VQREKVVVENTNSIDAEKGVPTRLDSDVEV